MFDETSFTRGDLVRRASKLAAALAVAGPLGALADAEAATGATLSSGDALTQGRKQGFLRAAFILEEPFCYVDPSGKLVGSGPAVAEAVLKKIGIPKVEPILVDFNAMIPGLLANRWDLSAFSFYITPDRCAQIAFTNPMAQYREAALVKQGNPLKIHSYTDMAKNPKVRIAVVAGDAEGDWAKQAGVKASQISFYPKEALAVEAVKIGRADVYLNGDIAVQQDIKNYGQGNLELVKPFTGPIIGGKEVIAYGGWGMRKTDIPLLNAFNKQLHKMLLDGELLRLEAPAGYTKAMMPPPNLTAKDLCPAANWGAGYQQIR